MTQLLLDSNYIPLILKMFAHQDVDQTVAHKNDREDLSYVTQPHSKLALPLTQPQLFPLLSEQLGLPPGNRRKLLRRH